tara:strand:- start:1968 stop:2882 length:915 start_codon:yes stop_codon:yes gene_type:complete
MVLIQRLRRFAQAALFGLLTGAAPASAAEPAQTPNPAEMQSDVAAGFTIYVGGVLFVEGHFKAEVAGDAYRLNTYMETTGLAHRLYPAVYKLMSMGRIAGESIEPEKFVSDTVARKDKRLVTLTYDEARMPSLSATPPYSEDDIKDVTPDQQRATQDPVSAFLLPVSAGDTPCARTIPIFDGKRRFNLTFAHQGTKKIAPHDTSTPDGWGASLDTIVCTMHYEAISPPAKKRRFTSMMRRNDEMKIWFAPFDEGRVYLPVRFEIPTPLGAAVMELKNLTAEKSASLRSPEKSALVVVAQEGARF